MFVYQLSTANTVCKVMFSVYKQQKLYFSAVVLEKQVNELLSGIPDLNG